jgi:hypothetical protein
MERDKVARAEDEAIRFLERAKEWRLAVKGDDRVPVAAGALRRASLDLTRSLAEMRKPRQWQ